MTLLIACEIASEAMKQHELIDDYKIEIKDEVATVNIYMTLPRPIENIELNLIV